MALIWKSPEPVVVPGPVKTGFNWDAWYAKNKERLSEKRAKRYREDAAYRNAALERSRQQREAKQPVDPGPYTVSFNDAAQALGVTVWVLREWRRKDYFPEPHHREGRLWFTPLQVKALDYLADHFRQFGPRVGEATRGPLENLVSLIYVNWN